MSASFIFREPRKRGKKGVGERTSREEEYTLGNDDVSGYRRIRTIVAFHWRTANSTTFPA